MQKSFLYILVCCLFSQMVISQELYVFSEPASNMPAHSLSAKLTYRTPVSKYNSNYRQRYTPEVMFGLNKHWMLHVSSSFSDFYTPQLRWESVKTYAKYRFYYGDINLDGENSGVQAGVIATQLVNKLAVSGTASVIKVFANRHEHVDQLGHSLNALYYSLSAGYLLFPINYSDYKQTNLNLYLETIGMKGFDKGDYMLDLAPALQLIFNSNLKINLGARLQVTGNMLRVGENNYFIGVERTFLGALRHRKKSS